MVRAALQGCSKCLTALLRHNNTYEFQRIRRNRTQGDVALIDFLLTEAMQRNFPRLCPASLWALAHCMNKQRFTFGTAVGTDNLRCHPSFKNRFDEYLRVEKRVNPAEYEVVTIASAPATPLSSQERFQKENLRILSTSRHAPIQGLAASAMVLISAMPRASSDQGLDVDYGVRTGLARRNMIHFCVAPHQLPLKRQGLYCYLDLQVAIVDLGLKVMYSKTAQVVLVEDRVPPEALCLTWREPADLGCMVFAQ